MSKFDDLCSIILESITVDDVRVSTPGYKLNPEFNSSELTGIDRAVANYLETKSGNTDEIVNIIAQNSDDPDDLRSAKDAFDELISGGLIIPDVSSDTDYEDEDEPDIGSLSDEPTIDDIESVDVIDSEDDEEDEDDSYTVPPPEEDEEDSFDANTETGSIVPPDDEGDEEDGDDTSTSDLIKQSEEKKNKMKNLIKHIYNKRGKSEEEANQHIQRLIKQGII